MSDASAFELLRAAHSFIGRIWPGLSPAELEEGTSLLARIAAAVREDGLSEASPALINEARGRWHDTETVHIADRARIHSDARGLWISAWLLLGAGKDRVSEAQFREALGALPIMVGEVYTLRRVDGLAFYDIACRLGLGIPEVERLFFDALRGLHQHIHSGN